ncbi:MAG TPA: hypothetical protein VI790_04440 [Candidatus Nanoarchaeia archaeon]|nr:hypothetical protein [Candidatus Nanoarchaeia archaeon]
MELYKIIDKIIIDYQINLTEHVYIIRPGGDDSQEITTTGVIKQESRPKLIISGLEDKSLAWSSLVKPKTMIIPLTDLEELLNKGGQLTKDNCTLKISLDKHLKINYFDNDYDLTPDKVNLIKQELESYKLFERLKPYIINMLKID